VKPPWSTLGGEKDGLSITLTAIPGVEYFEASKHFSFAVHNVDELPTVFERAEKCEIRHGMDLDVLISPEVVQTEDDLIEFSVDERQCYMEGERKLRFFKHYSVRNCEMECLTNRILEKCNCVAFFMMRNSTMPICGVSQPLMFCIREVEVEVRLKENQEIRDRCNCLPTCNTLDYKLEYFYNEIKPGSNESNQITINFRFKNNDFLPQKRFRRMTAVWFLAEGAGLLGLYCGVSILTIVELFYFLMVRPVTNFFRRLRGNH
jgi:acid-sensing ion channel, other